MTWCLLGACGSSRHTRVEPRLHCMGIAWQVRGRCLGSAAHSPRHTIAARALSAARATEPRPTHFARHRAHLASRALIAQSADFAWVRTLYLGSRTLQPAHLAAHALISFPMQFSTRSICDPSKPRLILSNSNTIFNPRSESESLPKRVNHATNLSKQQPFRRVSNLVAFQNFAKYKDLHFVTTIPRYISRISCRSIIMLILITWYLLCLICLLESIRCGICCQEICS